MSSRLFLDFASTTPIHPLVLETMNEVLNDSPGNPSSVHNEGRKAKFIIEETREKVAQLLSLEPAEIIFTSGATESINTVLKSFFFQKFPEKANFFSSEVEHHATLHSLVFLKSKGANITYLPVDNLGDLLPFPHIHPNVFYSLLAVNNELGTILSPQIISDVKKANSYIHIDGVQALGKIDIQPYLNANYLSFSGHKIQGPRGIGLLVVRGGSELVPLLHGGSHERNRRAGTEDTAKIAGFGKALSIALESQPKNNAHVKMINHYLRGKISQLTHTIKINSPETGSPYILNFTYSQDKSENIDGEAMILALDGNGISISNGSACASGSFEPSHVLSAIGKTEYQAKSTLRVSFSAETTIEDIDRFIHVFERILNRMKLAHKII